MDPQDIRKWLQHRADDEFFTFDTTEFLYDCDEILQGYAAADDLGTEHHNRNHYWGLLRDRQRDREYLSSLNLHRVIAKHLRMSCRNAHADETIESWIKLGLDCAPMVGLAEEIEDAIRDAWKVRTPLRADCVPKFSEALSFDSLDKFHLGLENIIGYPPTNTGFLASMKREHEQGKLFADRKGEIVDPRVEWNIVMKSDTWNVAGAGCEPTTEISKRECRQPVEFYVQKSKEIFANASDSGAHSDTLNEAEVAALRLWTGPMHKEYAEELRNPQKSNGPYVTTLHAINSGITKLARIWRLPVGRKVYRGYRNLTLKDLKKDRFQCVGGVEKCVLATSEDFDIAVHYSGDGALILEIEVGQVNRGADVSWLSQFPHEREILFNSLSNVEFVCSPQQRFVERHGTILVYKVCVSSNVKSKTLEEFARLRKDLHLNLVELLTQEAQRMIYTREVGSRNALIKDLGAKCRSQCDAILREAEEANVCEFNQGSRKYLSLVEAAIMLQSRTLEIIDLTVRWFETNKADPAEVDLLQDWQLQALIETFQSNERPEVTTLALGQDRDVGSVFSASSLQLGVFHKPEELCAVAKMLRLNPKLNELHIEAASATAGEWQKVFEELCAGRQSLCVNGIFPSEYACITLQRLDCRNSGIQMARMLVAALITNTPSSLTSLSFWGSRMACEGAESLGRAFSGLQRLRYLDLRSCQIADRGCSGLSLNLSALTELQELKLTHNKVNDDGFNMLSSAIRSHGLPRLKSVDMRYNNTQLPSELCGSRCVIQNHFDFSMLMTNANVSCVAWSPGGDQIASGSWDHSIITIWDAETGDQVSKLEGHTTGVNSVAWRPGGDRIASASDDMTIIVWDAKTGKGVWSLKGHVNWVLSVAWHPRGDQIVSGGYGPGDANDRFIHPGEIIIWNVKTGSKVAVLKGHTKAVSSVAWHPEGDQIASGSADMTIIVWDAKTGDKISTLFGHQDRHSEHMKSVAIGHIVQSVVWSPKGNQIASGPGTQDYTIRIWDPKSGALISTLKGHTNYVRSVAWCPVGDQIVSGGYGSGNGVCLWEHPGEIIIWDVKTGSKVAMLNGHSKAVSCVAWRPRSNQIISASFDQAIIIWDPSKQVSILKGHSGPVNGVAWCPGGDRIVSGGNGAGSAKHAWNNPGEIIIWDAKTGEQVSELKGHSKGVTSVAWRPGGDQIASASDDKMIIIWDAKTGKKVSTLQGHTSYVKSVAWRPGGDQIASGSYDNTIIIWDSMTGHQVSTLKGHTRPVMCVAWRPEARGDRIASGSCDSTIIIWDAKSAKQVWTLKGHTKPVYSVAWHPGGDQVVSGGYEFGSDTGEIIIWDANTGNVVLNLKGHTKGVTSVAWHPGGDQIVSGSGDPYFPESRNEIFVWDAKTGDHISTLKGHSSAVMYLAWCPGGDQIASGSCDSTIIIWDAKTGDQISTLKYDCQRREIASMAWRRRLGAYEIASSPADEPRIESHYC